MAKEGRTTVYNKGLVTDEKWNKVNKENKELLEEYLRGKKGEGLADTTLKQYKNDLKIFFCWLLENAQNKHFTEVTKRDLSRYQSFLVVECQLSSKRVRRLRSTVSSCGNYIEAVMDDEFEDYRSNINKLVAPPNNAVREKTILLFSEFEEVADKLVLEGKYMLASIITIACYSGLRQRELTRLLVKDFTTDIDMQLGDSFYKTSKIKVKGRGDKREEKYVWNKCDKWLKLWLKFREENNIKSEFLFCKSNGEQLEASTMSSYATTLDRYFGKCYYWHSARHTTASELMRAGLPIDVVQFLLSHQSAETSKLYVDISDAENMEQFNDFFSGKNTEIVKKGLGDI